MPLAPIPFLREIFMEPEKVEDPSVFPFNIPVIRNFDRLVFDPKVTFLVGENGTGDGFFLRAESFYNVVSALDDVGATRYGGRSLHSMSHGESFLALFDYRFVGNSLFVFDEPEAALSPQRQLVLLAHLHRLAEAEGCQFVIATHSPILLGYPGGTIYELEDGAIRRVAYEETATYRVVRSFLLERDRLLRRLLDPED